MVTSLQQIEGNDPRIGGFHITYPSGYAKTLYWTSGKPVLPTLDAAKKYAAVALQDLIDQQKTDDADRTNWASVTAAIQRIVSDWNDKLSKHLHVQAGNDFT